MSAQTHTSAAPVPDYSHGLRTHITPDPHPSFQSGQPHLISKIESFYVRPRWLFVRVETDTGVVGWGEGTLEGHTDAVRGSLREIEERLVGWNAMNIEEIWMHLFRHRFYRGGPVLMSAISGLDIALWDIKGKVFGVPVWELLGGKVRDKCRVYGPLGAPSSPEKMVEMAKERIADGHTKVKMPGPEMLEWLDSPRKLDEAVTAIATVRETGLDIAMDFHGRCHKGMAKQLAGLLEPHRPFFIEEPILPGHIAELKELYALTKIPIALGERLHTRAEVRPYLEAACIDLLQPDLAHAGGITEVRKIAAMAETYDVGLAPHCPLGPPALAACLQVGFSTPNFVIQEMSLGGSHDRTGYNLLTYLKDPSVFDVKNGAIALLTRPGIGIEIDEGKVRAEAEENLKLPKWRNAAPRGEDGSIVEW